MNLRIVTQYNQGRIDMIQAERLRIELYHALGGKDNPTGAIKHQDPHYADNFIEATKVRRCRGILSCWSENPRFDIISKTSRYSLEISLRPDVFHADSLLSVQINYSPDDLLSFDEAVDRVKEAFKEVYRIASVSHGR